MTKKKITAPLSYDPGKGRPKEYLAYLNWQEMQALRRLNGGNMERGPRGLPSFPPDDAIGSNQTPGSGNWTGAPGGATTGSGNSGSSNYGRDPSSWSGSGASYSGAGSSASSAASSMASASSAASANTTDTSAQQAAAINNAAAAANNSALAEDSRRGGIGSINVGPMQTPVKIGESPISAAVNNAVQQAYSPITNVTPTMPGGGGMGQFNARRGSSTIAVGQTAGIDAFGNIATGSLWGTSPSAAKRYDSLESDLAKRSLSEAFGVPQSQVSPYVAAPQGVLGPRVTPDVPSYMRIASMPGIITTGMPSGYSGIIRNRNETIAYKTPDKNVTVAYKSPDTTVTSYAPSKFETEVFKTSYRPTFASGTFTDPYNAASPITLAEQQGIDKQYQYMGINSPGYDIAPDYNTDAKTLNRLESVFASYGQPETQAETKLAQVEEEYRAQPGPIRVAPGDGYFTHPDGTPFTAEDIRNLPPDVYKEYMDKERWKRQTDSPYPLTPEQEQKAKVAGLATKPITGNPLVNLGTGLFKLVGGGISMLPGAVGQFGEDLQKAASAIRDPAEAVRKYEAANPLRQAQISANVGKPGYVPGTGPATSMASYSSASPVRELGGKGNGQSYSGPIAYQGPAYNQTADSADETGRPYNYYLWDLGVGIPSPGDPDYNDYMKYLKSRGTSAQV